MGREHRYFVYVLTNWNHRVIYIGMTSNLALRVDQHRRKAVAGFTSTYRVTKLVYMEETSDVHAALSRERQIKKWRREKKDALVSLANPE